MGSPTVEKKRSVMEAPKGLARKICLGSTRLDVSEFPPSVSFYTQRYIILNIATIFLFLLGYNNQSSEQLMNLKVVHEANLKCICF